MLDEARKYILFITAFGWTYLSKVVRSSTKRSGGWIKNGWSSRNSSFPCRWRCSYAVYRYILKPWRVHVASSIALMIAITIIQHPRPLDQPNSRCCWFAALNAPPRLTSTEDEPFPMMSCFKDYSITWWGWNLEAEVFPAGLSQHWPNHTFD